MSAKNAWGTTTGYAEDLIAQGMEATRAQQLENWNNQQEVLNKKRQQKYMTEDFDKVSSDENWRSLTSFGVERNQVRCRRGRRAVVKSLLCAGSSLTFTPPSRLPWLEKTTTGL
jgi:hypothetical protein